MTNEETTCQRLAAIEAQIKSERELRLALKELLDERNEANQAAIRAAFISAEKASDKTELALKEYKIGSNEWRATVNDLVSRITSRGEGLHQGWLILLGLASLAGTVAAIIIAFRK